MWGRVCVYVSDGKEEEGLSKDCIGLARDIDLTVFDVSARGF